MLGGLHEVLLELVRLLVELVDHEQLRVREVLLHLRLELGLERSDFRLEVPDRGEILLLAGLELGDAGAEAILLALERLEVELHRLALVRDAAELGLGDLALADELGDLLVELEDGLLDLGELGGLVRGARLPRLEVLDRVEPGALRVVVPAGEGPLAVVLVAVERDRVEVVLPCVRSRDLEVLADDRLAKDLLERERVLWVKLELLDPEVATWISSCSRASTQGHVHRNRLLRVRVLDVLVLEPVQRDERHPAALLLEHDVEDLGRGLVRVDDDLEETRARGDLDRGLVPVLDREELVQRAVVALEVEPRGDRLDRLKTLVRVLQTGGSVDCQLVEQGQTHAVHHGEQLPLSSLELRLGVFSLRVEASVDLPEVSTRLVSSDFRPRRIEYN